MGRQKPCPGAKFCTSVTLALEIAHSTCVHEPGVAAQADAGGADQVLKPSRA
jgi:hypothetical protein